MSRPRLGRRTDTITRRQALTAATIGAGLATGTVVGVAAAHDAPRKNPDPGAGAGDPVVVRVKDLGAGTLEIFTGTERVEVRDRDLANRLSKAARKR